ncbi:MAG: helix-turn-helix transcriptional regulator [Hydrogenophaga sp.]|jgi:AraC-like DNA-binding protein|nr:helix-turn-helix transcriptional regulator [Hydrogenophaga sp.]
MLRTAAVNRPPSRRSIPLGDTDPFVPTPQRPVRCRARQLDSDKQVEPHHHAWGQLAYCASGVLRVAVAEPLATTTGRPGLETTTIVPPSRAVWIPPGARHAVTILEDAQLLTLYVDASVVPPHWTGSRVLMVSPLLRELIRAMDQPHLQHDTGAQRALCTLVIVEMDRAATQSLGVPMPSASHGDRRLRALCEAVLNNPARHATLAGWAAHSGASERTLARLFRCELGTGFQRWRQQVVLAHALPMLARGVSVGRVAQASGYASESAFSAMFKSAMGQPPTSLAPRGQAVSASTAAA